MSPAVRQPSREDVLDAFAVEPNPGRKTLERYLRDYPSYASELVDLSRELSGNICDYEVSLSAEDQALIESAWQRHVDAAPKVVSDPFAALSVTELRQVAKQLDVPRQIITAFRERRVIVSSVPRRFLGRLAEAVNSTADIVVATLTLQPGPALARTYKSDSKPAANAAVTFERLLIDAGVPEEKRALLMSDAD
jgi:hypothetical protein